MTNKDIFLSLPSKSSNISKAIRNLESSDMIEKWLQYGNIVYLLSICSSFP